MRQKAKATALKACKACGTAGHWMLRAAAMGGAAFSGLAIFMFAMLGSEGISLGVFRPAIESVIEAKTGAEAVSVGRIHLIRDGDELTPFRVRVTDIQLDQGGGTELNIPGVSIRLDSNSTLRGQPLPKFVEVAGAEIVVERGGDGVSLGGRSDEGSPFDVGAFTSQAKSAGFEGAILRDLSLRYTNRLTGAKFNVDGGTASLRSLDGTYAFQLNVPYEDYDGSLVLDLFARPQSESVEATLTVQRVPASAVLPLFMGEARGFDLQAPISGTVTAEGGTATGFEKMGIALYIGEGQLFTGKRPMPIRSVVVDGVFTPETMHLDLDRVTVDASGNKADAHGDITLLMTDGGVEAVSFEVNATDIMLDPDGLFDEPLPLATARASGQLDLLNRAVVMDEMTADFFGAQVEASGRYLLPELPGQSPGMHANVEIHGALSPKQVLRGWPTAFGDGARRWIDRSLPSGRVTDVTYTMDIPRGALVEGAVLTPEQLDLKFKAQNATVIYVPGMRPITGLSAVGQLKGNSFLLDGTGGRIGDVRIRNGKVRMMQLSPKGAPGVFTATAAGNVPDLLAILDEEPLGFLAPSGFRTEQFSGIGEFTIEVSRPLLDYVPTEDYGYKGHGTFTDLEVDDLLPGDVHLDRASGSVLLSKQALTIEGVADAEGIPTDFSLVRQFGDVGNMSLFASTKIDGRAADSLGLPFRRFFQGDIDLQFSAQGHSGKFHRLQVKGDLTDATLTGDAGDIVKAPGTAGDLVLDLDLSAPDKAITIEGMRITTGGMNIEGNARFEPGRGLVDLDIPRLFIENYSDLSVRMRRDAADLVVKIEGEYIYLGAMISDLLKGKSGGMPGNVEFDAQVLGAELKGGVAISNVRLRGRKGPTGLQTLEGNAQFTQGEKIKLSVTRHSSGLGRLLVVDTEDVGQLLGGIFSLPSVVGGEGEFQAVVLDSGSLAGSFQAENLTVQEAPTVARLLSVGSLDGLANVLNGEGLEFENLSGDLQIEDGVLRFVDTRLTGSSLGLSANGEIDLQHSGITIYGAIAPAYQLNSFLGAIPAVGELLVSREGEGVFALAYRVEGELAEPVVSVNSLAALAPGIFRRMFEPVTRQRPTTEEILNAADEAAAMDEARQYLSTPELLQEHENWRERQPDGDPAPR